MANPGKQKHPALAFLLGFLLGGWGLFYVLPPRKALAAAVITTLLIVGSGGILWVPVAIGCGLYALRLATRGSALAFHGEPAPELSSLEEHEPFPTPEGNLASPHP